MILQTKAERDAYYTGIKVGGIIILILVFLISNVSAATTIPRIEPYVNDFAGVLSPQDELRLNQLADGIENRTTFEIAIVIVSGTGGEDRLEFANKIGDQNGVGKKDKDNGVVVLWSMSSDAGGAIATGRGSESFLTDSMTGTIGRAARSYFDKGDYYGGMNYIVTELDKVIVAHQEKEAITLGGSDSSDSKDNSFWIWLIIFPISLFLAFKFINSLFSESSDDYEYEPGYYRKQVYKRHGKWYHPESDRSYLTAAAAAAALATMNIKDDCDSDDSSDNDSGSFSGGSFGGGGVHF